MKPTTFLFALPLAALGLGGLLLTGCAVAGQPISGGMMAKRSFVAVEQEQPVAAQTQSVFAGKKMARRKQSAAQALVAAEPAPEPTAAPESASAVQAPTADETPSKQQPQVADEPAPKKSGPLTRAEENEIDTQVMP